MANVISTKTDAVVGERAEDIFQIDSVLLNQGNNSIEQLLDQAAANRQSIAVSINNVIRISKDSDTDVSLTAFSSFLNRVKTLEEQGLFQVMTYSEFQEYQIQKEKDTARLTKQYSEFKSEMQVRMEEIDQEEKEIVERVMQEG